MGVHADGRRELLGIKVRDRETEGFWSEFIASLKERGLTGVKLIVSDAHVGLIKAIRRQLQGCFCQASHRKVRLVISTVFSTASWKASPTQRICCRGCPRPTKIRKIYL